MFLPKKLKSGLFIFGKIIPWKTSLVQLNFTDIYKYLSVYQKGSITWQYLRNAHQWVEWLLSLFLSETFQTSWSFLPEHVISHMQTGHSLADMGMKPRWLIMWLIRRLIMWLIRRLIMWLICDSSCAPGRLWLYAIPAVMVVDDPVNYTLLLQHLQLHGYAISSRKLHYPANEYWISTFHLPF